MHPELRHSLRKTGASDLAPLRSIFGRISEKGFVFASSVRGFARYIHEKLRAVHEEIEKFLLTGFLWVFEELSRFIRVLTYIHAASSQLEGAPNAKRIVFE